MEGILTAQQMHDGSSKQTWAVLAPSAQLAGLFDQFPRGHSLLHGMPEEYLSPSPINVSDEGEAEPDPREVYAAVDAWNLR